MILADTSVWLDHLRRPDEQLQRLLTKRQLLMHSMVIGEIAMGSISLREGKLNGPRRLPQVVEAHHEEVLYTVNTERLWRLGIGYVDTHLLVSVKLTADCALWSRDKRLHSAAEKFGLAWPEPKPSLYPLCRTKSPITL